MLEIIQIFAAVFVTALLADQALTLREWLWENRPQGDNGASWYGLDRWPWDWADWEAEDEDNDTNRTDSVRKER